MTTMTNITSLWHLFVTVLILTERTWSVCGSMELPASHRLRKSRQPSVGRFDSDIGSVALESLMEKSVDRLNLPVDCASAASPMSCKRRSRVLLRTVQNDLQNSRNEVEVLIAFKVRITGDPLGVLSSWRANDSDPCSWLGIACGKSSKRVTSLYLSSLQLAGAVSAVLGQLSFLRYLDLSNNSFTGEIPEALGNCSRLKYLALGQNNLQGGIPSTLGNCSSLTQLSLESNPGLGGELPLELGNLILLQGFTIHNCSLQGSFPTWLLNFTDMQDLDLGFNQFSGDIPPALGKISKLYSLNLEGNSFTGEIPVSIGLLGQLQEMYLDDNELSGEIPTSIGNITYLLVLCLFKNNLTGEIPRSIVNTSLQSIQIHQNQLTGELPHDIGLLSDLEFIRINNNALSGSIPSSISNCTSITYLSLGVNAFSPQVFPSWILPLTGLTEAYFPQMNLQGAIPEEIGQLSELSQLSLYSNNLTGVLPSSLGNCTSLRYLDITSNAISGKVPPELGLLSGMISFLIGSNSFSPGPFPTFLYNFTMITQLEVSDNEFTGMLDGDFGRFAALNEFNASHNKFQGPVPSSFSNCSNLNYIDVGQNYMSGDVPGWLFNLTNLRRIGLSSNKFSGVIPVDFGSNFQLLEELDLSDNNLEGTIPVNVGRLVSLEYVYLQANNFTGVLPHALANCTHLIELDISQNKLSGDVSGDAFPTTPPMLTKLNLSHNLFSGSWPSQFSLLTSIRVIDVSHNRMSGPIPLGLANCFILQSLDVSFNMFNGSIPQDLALLTHLTTFNASYNNFVGPIPDQGIFGTNLTATSFLGDPGLCGPILGPQRQCPTPVNAPQGSSHCTSFKCTRLWIPLFSVLGTVFFLITVLLTVYYCRGKKKDSRVVQDDKLEMYIVNPRMVFLEKDLLAAIAPGQGKVIGTGAKSIVYKAVSPDDDSIAIKVLRDVQHPWKQDQRDKDQWEKEIMNEVRTLGQLRHRNIIKIFTLCFSLDIKAIVLEYMPNGSLHGHLHDNGNCDLTWAQRFRILLGVTHGLVYLHHEFSDPIIHRDLKASNILLDEDLEPKLCDFGISKFVTNEHGEATATAFCGTFGYIPPEYGTGARLSTKGDVYSYGVVLLELLSAKEATEANRMIPAGGIVEDRFLLSDVQAFELLDPTLKSEGAKNIEVREQMLSTMRVGHSCTNRQPESRPTMNDVLLMLLEIQQI